MTVQNSEQILQENIALRKENLLLKEEYSNLQQQFEWLKKQVFGRKTEQSEVILENGTQMTLFVNDAEKKAPEKTVEVKSHPRKKKRIHDEWMSTLFIEEKEHKEEHPICDKCGSEMVEIGVDKVYDELVYTPAKYHIRRHIVYVYKCTNCGEDPENDDPDSGDIEKCNIRRAYYSKPMIPGQLLLARITCPHNLSEIRYGSPTSPSGERSGLQRNTAAESNDVELGRSCSRAMDNADLASDERAIAFRNCDPCRRNPDTGIA